MYLGDLGRLRAYAQARNAQAAIAARDQYRARLAALESERDRFGDYRASANARAALLAELRELDKEIAR